MTWAAKLILILLFLPVAVLFIRAWVLIAAYLIAVARAVLHVEATTKLRYLVFLSFMNFPAAEQLMTTDVGKVAHDQVMHRLNRGVRSFFGAFGSFIVAMVIALLLQLAGVLPFE